ncbi:hypothetical protein OH809_43975 (plasmid) [Streptomyces sp. NBC_00873]|uniref:hypothetical protein n=1 Tax=unclassified Streptomyces TaxID=2593676 RepID=UPI0038662E9C|nr:hypothetical protein OH809_43975 [Streptomyces sp. NBC_00873]WTA49165.1 hypothetical protein OH821_44520 [Streptomyces sp. NBC_00842]
MMLSVVQELFDAAAPTGGTQPQRRLACPSRFPGLWFQRPGSVAARQKWLPRHRNRERLSRNTWAGRRVHYPGAVRSPV